MDGKFPRELTRALNDRRSNEKRLNLVGNRASCAYTYAVDVELGDTQESRCSKTFLRRKFVATRPTDVRSTSALVTQQLFHSVGRISFALAFRPTSGHDVYTCFVKLRSSTQDTFRDRGSKGSLRLPRLAKRSREKLFIERKRARTRGSSENSARKRALNGGKTCRDGETGNGHVSFSQRRTRVDVLRLCPAAWSLRQQMFPIRFLVSRFSRWLSRDEVARNLERRKN